jgi:dTDP-4-amino-4,6-dideoxy-D-galactose acyltransferase
MPSIVEAREATADDVGDIATLLRRLWAAAGPDAPGYAGATDAGIEELAQPPAIEERLGRPDRRMFLAGDEDDWLGFAATRRIDAARCELAGILVLEEATGRGVGSALVAAAVARARIDGATQMIVRTEVGNDRAIAFYRSAGFTPTEETVEMVGDTPVPVVELERHL